MAYTGIQPVPKATQRTIDGTVKSDTDLIEVSGGYPVGHIELYVEGRLIPRDEYIAADGASIQLRGYTLSAGTKYTIVVISTFELSDHYNKEQSDERYLVGTTNHFMNGRFLVNQRQNTSGEGGMIHDRWFVRRVSGSGGTVNALTGADSDFNNEAIPYLALQCSSMTSYTAIRQRVEDVTAFMGKKVCVSFDVGSDVQIGCAAKGILSLRGESNYEEPSRYSVSEFITIDSKETVGTKRVSFVLDMPYSSRIKEGREGLSLTESYFEISIYFFGSPESNFEGSTFTEKLEQYPGVPDGSIRLSNMTLNIGDKDAGYYHVPYADELARCQRYFFKDTQMNLTGFVTTPDQTYANATVRYFEYNFPTTMRIRPSVVATQAETTNASGSGDPTFVGISTNSVRLNYATPATNGFIRITGITLDAEL